MQALFTAINRRLVAAHRLRRMENNRVVPPELLEKAAGALAVSVPTFPDSRLVQDFGDGGLPGAGHVAAMHVHIVADRGNRRCCLYEIPPRPP
jgi:hypothetical protein